MRKRVQISNRFCTNRKKNILLCERSDYRWGPPSVYLFFYTQLGSFLLYSTTSRIPVWLYYNNIILPRSAFLHLMRNSIWIITRLCCGRGGHSGRTQYCSRFGQLQLRIVHSLNCFQSTILTTFIEGREVQRVKVCTQ